MMTTVQSKATRGFSMVFRKIRSWLKIIGATTAPPAGPMPNVDITPDAPTSFGYKINWFAIKTDEPTSVLRALELTEVETANWATGIAAAYAQPGLPDADAFIFISPPVDGWVFIAGANLPYPDQRESASIGQQEIGRRFDRMFAALHSKFLEVQFFASYRVVGLDAWARAKNGRIDRIFCIADGDVLANVGSQTAEERSLKFIDLSGLSAIAARDAIFADAEQRNEKEYELVAQGHDRSSVQQQMRRERRDAIPTEEDTMAVAGAWSVDPSDLEQRQLSPSVGFVARFTLSTLI